MGVPARVGEADQPAVRVPDQVHGPELERVDQLLEEVDVLVEVKGRVGGHARRAPRAEQIGRDGPVRPGEPPREPRPLTAAQPARVQEDDGRTLAGIQVVDGVGPELDRGHAGASHERGRLASGARRGRSSGLVAATSPMTGRGRSAQLHENGLARGRTSRKRPHREHSGGARARTEARDFTKVTSLRSRATSRS